MSPFKWKLSACTFTWCYLFAKILENEICKFGRNLPLATFGSEGLRVKMSFYISGTNLPTTLLIFFQFFRMVKTKIEVEFQPFLNRFMPQKPTFIT